MQIGWFGIIGAMIAFSASGQTAQPAAGTVIDGRVVTMAGMEQRPVRRAKVTLTGRGLASPRVVDTDSQGMYRIDRLPAGGYRVTVEKPGFVKLETDARSSATLTIIRGGAITGVITDAAGDPVWNIAVTAMQATDNGAKLRTIAQTRTDDLGRYRLHSLPSGSYYVQAATDGPFLAQMFLVPGEKRPEVNRSFYPAGDTLAEARSVPVLQGEDTRAVDLAFTPAVPEKNSVAPSPSLRMDATGTASIAGRVLDRVSGLPIRSAKLLLLPIEGQQLTNWTRTDAHGRFEYTALRARRYTLRAQADRFVSLEFGQERPDETGTQIILREGDKFTADMTLPRGGALEGTLADEFGDPAPNVTVQIARRQYTAGRQRLVPLSGRLETAVTDDRGHYRLCGLAPGEYYVAGLSGAYTDGNEVGGFRPTYYPGTADSAAATPIKIELGADAAALFTLVPAKTFGVSGTMLDGEGKPVPAGGTIWFTTPDKLQRMDLNIAHAVTSSDGRFVFRNVPEGNYTLQGFAPPTQAAKAASNLGAMPFGWTSVTVAGTDIEDVLLSVTSGTVLRGKIVVDNAAIPPPNAAEVRIMALPVEFDSAPIGGGPPPSETRDNLTFEVTKLSGIRRLFVDVSSERWSLRKITVNELDITDAPVDFRTKDVDGVEVVLTSAVTRLSGTVSDDKGPVTNCAVVVFASDPAKWIDRSRFVILSRPTQYGHFNIHGLPPDEYLVIALVNVADAEWRDPEFLQHIRTQATVVTLLDGELKFVDLKLKKRP